MNKDNAKEFLPLVQALADGKTIRHKGAAGYEISFNGNPCDYDIKPDPFEAKVWAKGSCCLTFNESQCAQQWESEGWKLITVIEKP